MLLIIILISISLIPSLNSDCLCQNVCHTYGCDSILNTFNNGFDCLSNSLYACNQNIKGILLGDCGFTYNSITTESKN